MRLTVVVPFLNEERCLGELLRSISTQDRLPDRVMLVDDGSSDGSVAQAEEFAARHPFALALRRPRQERTRDRLAQASELRAFQWAVEELGDDWDIVAKLDADLRLPPCTFRELLDRLDEDPRLGIAGSFLAEEQPEGHLARLQNNGRHVHGATKFYRRACWEQIAPLPPILGWDTIDEIRAQMRGWRTASFALPGGDPVHLRPRGSYDGQLRGFRRWGECAYAFGSPASFVLLQAGRYMRQPPRILGGAHYALGWIAAAVRRQPRAEAELLAHIRRTQRGQIVRRLIGR